MLQQTSSESSGIIKKQNHKTEENNMKIYQWNIGMAAAIPSSHSCVLQKWVIDELINEKPDCIVLTEFVIAKGIDYYLDQLEIKGYHWFISSSTKANGILIALNKESFLFDNTFNYHTESVITGNQVLTGTDIPDFYEIRVTYNNKPLSIIGVRIKTSFSNNKTHKQNQFKALDMYLATLTHDVICIGDFGTDLQQNHILPNTKCSFDLYTPTFDDYWWSYVQPNSLRLQLDHLISNIKNKKISVRYDWDYLSKHRIGIQPASYKLPCGLPDHAILKAEIN